MLDQACHGQTLKPYFAPTSMTKIKERSFVMLTPASYRPWDLSEIEK
jgi:hypothetical protein